MQLMPANKRDQLEPWDLMRSGDLENGLALIRKRSAGKSSASDIMELGVAYLWIGDYQSACVHFEKAIETYPRSMDCFFGMTGVAQWCMGQHSDAVEYWRRGLRAQYADAAGLGVQLPLLLFVASIVDPEVFPKKKAEAILREKAKDLRAGYWPAVLARFVLGEASSEEALETIEEREIFGRQHGLWWIRFYGHLLEYDSGVLTLEELAERMRSLTDTSNPLFSERVHFLAVLWSESFFIARHIAETAQTLEEEEHR